MTLKIMFLRRLQTCQKNTSVCNIQIIQLVTWSDPIQIILLKEDGRGETRPEFQLCDPPSQKEGLTGGSERDSRGFSVAHWLARDYHELIMKE